MIKLIERIGMLDFNSDEENVPEIEKDVPKTNKELTSTETLYGSELLDLLTDTVIDEYKTNTTKEVFERIREFDASHQLDDINVDKDYDGFYLFDNNTEDVLELDISEVLDILSVAYGRNVVKLLEDNSEPREGTMWIVIFE